MTRFEDMKFYHGTSTSFGITTVISPAVKATNKETNKTLYKRRTAKIQITTDLDTAIYFAKKASEERGGEPIVFQVIPDRMSLIKRSKTEFFTARADVIQAIPLAVTTNTIEKED